MCSSVVFRLGQLQDFDAETGENTGQKKTKEKATDLGDVSTMLERYKDDDAW